jgi:hypothetical protein
MDRYHTLGTPPLPAGSGQELGQGANLHSTLPLQMASPYPLSTYNPLQQQQQLQEHYQHYQLQHINLQTEFPIHTPTELITSDMELQYMVQLQSRQLQLELQEQQPQHALSLTQQPLAGLPGMNQPHRYEPATPMTGVNLSSPQFLFDPDHFLPDRSRTTDENKKP